MKNNKFYAKKRRKIGSPVAIKDRGALLLRAKDRRHYIENLDIKKVLGMSDEEDINDPKVIERILNSNQSDPK